MDALDLMLSRESALKLESPGPSAEELDRIFASAVRAPDHGRLRPWHFVVIDEEQRAAFGALMADSLRRRDPSVSDAELQRERDKAFRAPVIVVVAAKVRKAPQDTGDRADRVGLGGGADDHAGGAGAGLWRGVEDRGAGVRSGGEDGAGAEPRTMTSSGFCISARGRAGPSPLPRPEARDFVTTWAG